jgi:N-acetylglucosaminyldiphosphoundecaprenol N-acetyl-beta-D-mannosaminyltransferase
MLVSLTSENGPQENASSSAVPPAPSHYALGARIHATSYDHATRQIVAWAKAGESKSVYAANVHTVMEAYDQPEFKEMVNSADLVTPDGVPLVWSLRRAGVRNASRVYGPDLTPLVLSAAEKGGILVGFYGSSPQVLKILMAKVAEEFPALRVVYAYAPPFRALSREEDDRITDEISASGARILFVGLGCPKQEKWIANHHGRVHAVMLGVGAAFDFLAGCKPQAPRWMMRMGLEWLFRFATEPKRLWKRYAKHNPRFAALMAIQLAKGAFASKAH